MKEFLLLYKGELDQYYTLSSSVNTKLYNLYMFITHEYIQDDENIDLNSLVRVFQHTYTVNDHHNKMMYIGLLADENIDEQMLYGQYNDIAISGTCKISIENFYDFLKEWSDIEKIGYPFVAFYRANDNWIYCDGFGSNLEMEEFLHELACDHKALA